jgi:hypothetical protein
MRSGEAVVRRLVAGIVLASLAGCQSLPARDDVRGGSSVLAVDVRFPFPLGRDPTLIRVFLVQGPIHAGMEELPPLVATSFVKGSRAYLLDPEPGTYSLVAVAFDYGPPLRTDPALGVRGVVASGADAGQTVVLSEPMIRRTRTAIGQGMVKLMGALEIRRGERIQAGTAFDDALQSAVAERIQPGVTSETGLTGMLSVIWKLDAGASTFADDAGVLDAFHRRAREDFGDSPWAILLPEPAREDRRPAQRAARRAPEAAVTGREPAPVPTAPPPDPMPPDPAASPMAVPPSEEVAPSGEPSPRATAPPPPVPDGEADDDPDVTTPIAALAPPPGHAFAPIEIGMTSDDVEAILGQPDERERSRTRRAWIPFYTGPDALRIAWIYTGRGRVVFSLHDGSLEVIDVVYTVTETP